MHYGQKYEYEYPFEKIILTDNLATIFEEGELGRIGAKVVEDYKTDEESRKPRMKNYEEAIKLASQIRESKTFPWSGASNAKFPLVTNACIAFNARVFPTLFPNKDIVMYEGRTGTEETLKIAKRVTDYQNYQLTHEQEEWLSDMDKLTLVLPLTANEFKKVYFDFKTQSVVSELVNIKNLCINYNARSIDKAPRITHLIPLTKNDVYTYVKMGYFIDIIDDIGATSVESKPVSDLISGQLPSSTDDSTPYVFLEQHCFWDFDGDGYAEPYIITVEQNSRKVARIAKNFDNASVSYNAENEIVSITPDEYFIHYTFIPSFDGSLYSIAWGDLLLPINESVNTSLNQLIDAGTLNNLPSGFLGKSLRVPGGNYSMTPGEWKFLNNSGQSLKDNIVALPTKEPSPTLFNLLTLLLSSGKEMSMTVESLMGQNPGQNQPLGTTLQVMQNGLKMLEGIYIRIRTSLAKEVKLIQKLNSKYLDNTKYKNFFPNDPTASVSDFQVNPMIVPSAERSISAKELKRVRADFLMQASQTGGFRVQEVKKNLLEAYEIPNIERFLLKEEEIPPPPEDPSIVVAKIKAQTDLQTSQVKDETEKMKLELEAVRIQVEAQIATLKNEVDKYNSQIKEMKARIDGAAKMGKLELDHKVSDREGKSSE